MNTQSFLVSAVLVTANPIAAEAFCGFFVGRADAQLFNSASQVVIVHDDGKTVLTMVNDYRGPPENFALVVPVPVVLREDVVRVVDMAASDHLDAYTAPRLAEYHDPDPCHAPPPRRFDRMLMMSAAPPAEAAADTDDGKVLVEASYTVGEYDIVILSASQSDSLESWLRKNDYRIPTGTSSALRPYVRSGMKFFVAKVNLESLRGRQSKLRPLQFAFPDRRFMLPVRLGMLNADGPQDLIAYVITQDFRVETANYRNIKMPTNAEIPTFVKSEFADVYRAVFDQQVERAGGRAVFTEYGWNMSWCDPCAADPLSTEELETLGVWWNPPEPGGPSRGTNAYVTRLHARYDQQSFPEDLVLKATRDAKNYQVRFVLRNPFERPTECPAAAEYFSGVKTRREKEVDALASLTGWDRASIRARLVPLPPHFQTEPDGARSYIDRVREWFAQ